MSQIFFAPLSQVNSVSVFWNLLRSLELSSCGIQLNYDHISDVTTIQMSSLPTVYGLICSIWRPNQCSWILNVDVICVCTYQLLRDSGTFNSNSCSSRYLVSHLWLVAWTMWYNVIQATKLPIKAWNSVCAVQTVLSEYARVPVSYRLVMRLHSSSSSNSYLTVWTLIIQMCVNFASLSKSNVGPKLNRCIH